MNLHTLSEKDLRAIAWPDRFETEVVDRNYEGLFDGDVNNRKL